MSQVEKETQFEPNQEVEESNGTDSAKLKKKKMSKKLKSLIIALAVIIAIVGGGVIGVFVYFAKDKDVVSTLVYTEKEDGMYKIESFTAPSLSSVMVEMVLPDTYKGKPVTELA